MVSVAGGPGPNETGPDNYPGRVPTPGLALEPDTGPGPGQGLDWGGDYFPIRHIGTNYDDILFSRGHLTPDARSTEIQSSSAYITWTGIKEFLLAELMFSFDKVCLGFWEDLSFVPGHEIREISVPWTDMGPSSYIQSHLIFRKC